MPKDPIIIHGQYHSVVRARAFELYAKNPKAAEKKYPEFKKEWEAQKREKK